MENEDSVREATSPMTGAEKAAAAEEVGRILEGAGFVESDEVGAVFVVAPPLQA